MDIPELVQEITRINQERQARLQNEATNAATLETKYDKTGGNITGRAQMVGTDIGDAGEALLRVDATRSGMSNVPAFKVALNAAGRRRAFQITNGDEPYAWASFEWEAGGANRPGLAIGPGGTGPRDTNLYREGPNHLRTDGKITASGGVSVGNVTPPTTATSGGAAGDIRFDSNYVYVCIATNTWRRAPLASW